MRATPGRAWPVRVGAVAWLVQPLYVLCEVLVAAFVRAPYSWRDNTISDLGAATCTDVPYPFGPVPVCSPWHPLMNTAFVVFGVLLGVGAVLLRPWMPRPRWAVAGVVCWVLGGLGSIGTGLTPLDQSLEAHVLVSTPTFVLQPLALLATGIALLPRPGALGGTGLAVGALTLVAAVVFFTRAGEPEWGGFWERVALWPVYAWTAVAALVVLRRPPEGIAAHRGPADAPAR